MFKSLPKKSITCFSGGLIVFGRHMNLIILTDLLKDPLIHPSIVCWIWFIAFAMPVPSTLFLGRFWISYVISFPPSHPHFLPLRLVQFIRNDSELHRAANGSHIYKWSGVLDQKGNSIFQIRVSQIVRCEMPLVAPPPPSWANQLPNVLASKFWSHWDVLGWTVVVVLTCNTYRT